MKLVKDFHGMIFVELTRRNLETLLAKLDDSDSVCTLVGPTRDFMVRAVENDEHYSDRPAGAMWVNGEWV
jgi:hypothetical protein